LREHNKYETLFVADNENLGLERTLYLGHNYDCAIVIFNVYIIYW